MKFGVLVFPGSNCDADMVHVLKDVFDQEVETIWHKSTDLSHFTTNDCIIVPGGFSYGDYLRTGAIARFSPIMDSVIDFANRGGKVLGICNGFQILCEAGLLPGALLRNDHGLFSCKNVSLKVNTTANSLTSAIPNNVKTLSIPIAHAEGRYYADSETIDTLKANNQILFTYSDTDGNVTDSSNPNGSEQSIAGICNKEGNVFGMMPHPERASEAALGNEDGRYLFESIIQSVN